MISLKVDNLKGELNQQLYDDYINLIDVHSLTCTCGNHDNVIQIPLCRNSEIAP